MRRKMTVMKRMRRMKRKVKRRIRKRRRRDEDQEKRVEGMTAAPQLLYRLTATVVPQVPSPTGGGGRWDHYGPHNERETLVRRRTRKHTHTHQLTSHLMQS
ncbi:hypothetical protein FHG87_011239 [Trinorchestia longiramus]|nr:hypothetical protein FHG87_011239 [Trinorchestia longiramus]